jgi:hypothetical protein
VRTYDLYILHQQLQVHIASGRVLYHNAVCRITPPRLRYLTVRADISQWSINISSDAYQNMREFFEQAVPYTKHGFWMQGDYISEMFTKSSLIIGTLITVIVWVGATILTPIQSEPRHESQSGHSGLQSEPRRVIEDTPAPEGTTPCAVCLTNKPVMVIGPCGHLCMCESCLTCVNKYPLCRKSVESRIRVFA